MALEPLTSDGGEAADARNHRRRSTAPSASQVTDASPVTGATTNISSSVGTQPFVCTRSGVIRHPRVKPVSHFFQFFLKFSYEILFFKNRRFHLNYLKFLLQVEKYTVDFWNEFQTDRTIRS